MFEMLKLMSRSSDFKSSLKATYFPSCIFAIVVGGTCRKIGFVSPGEGSKVVALSPNTELSLALETFASGPMTSTGTEADDDGLVFESSTASFTACWINGFSSSTTSLTMWACLGVLFLSDVVALRFGAMLKNIMKAAPKTKRTYHNTNKIKQNLTHV